MKKLIKRAAMMATLFLAFFGFSAQGWAQGSADVSIEHHFAQVIGATLAESDWECVFDLTDTSGQGGTHIIKLLDERGDSGAVESADFGINSNFAFQLGANQTKRLTIVRRSGFLGRAVVLSSAQAAIILTLNQYYPGTDQLAGSSNIPESTPESRVTLSLKTKTGLAIANPNTIPAQITLTQRNSQGVDTKTSSFTLLPGSHVSKFVDEFPFSLLKMEMGSVNIASNVPVVSVGFSFTGLIFNSIPIQPAYRGASPILSNLITTLYFVPKGVEPRKIPRSADFCHPAPFYQPFVVCQKKCF